MVTKSVRVHSVVAASLWVSGFVVPPPPPPPPPFLVVVLAGLVLDFFEGFVELFVVLFPLAGVVVGVVVFFEDVVAAVEVLVAFLLAMHFALLSPETVVSQIQI